MVSATLDEHHGIDVAIFVDMEHTPAAMRCGMSPTLMSGYDYDEVPSLVARGIEQVAAEGAGLLDATKSSLRRRSRSIGGPYGFPSKRTHGASIQFCWRGQPLEVEWFRGLGWTRIQLFATILDRAWRCRSTGGSTLKPPASGSVMLWTTSSTSTTLATKPGCLTSSARRTTRANAPEARRASPHPPGVAHSNLLAFNLSALHL